MGMVESFSAYDALLKENPQKAASLSQDICQRSNLDAVPAYLHAAFILNVTVLYDCRLMSVMGVTSADAEVEVAVKYYYMLARKPPEAWLLQAKTWA